MKQKTLTIALLGVLLLAGTMLFGGQPKPAAAGIFDSSSEVTYKEYWVHHNEFTGGCNADGTPANPLGTTFIEVGPKCPKTLNFTIPDGFANATKIEIYLDLWRNHDEPAAMYRLNSAVNPVHGTTGGSEYSSSSYVGVVPKGELNQGPNSITFTGAKIYQVQDIGIRIYYDADHPLVAGPGGDVTPPASGTLVSITDDSNIPRDPYEPGTLKVNADKLIFEATASADTKYIEFHGYLDGYDEDRDGDFIDWHSSGHNNWWPGGRSAKPNGGTINHIGTMTVPASGKVVLTWNLKHIVNQSGVKFKIRLVDAAGNVREGAGGISSAFTLARDYSVFYYMIPGFTDFGLHMFGNSPDSVNYKFTVPDSVNLGNVQEVLMIGAYTSKPKFSVNGSNATNTNPKSTINPDADENILGMVSVNKSLLTNGPSNSITYYYDGSGPLDFVQEPGPMFVYRNLSAPTDVTAPYILSTLPSNGSTNVDRRQSIVVHIGESGSGVDPKTIVMIVNGQAVSPKISGSSIDLVLTYTPANPYPSETVIPVTVSACDLLKNCMTDAHAFSFTTEPLDNTPPIISDIVVTSTDSSATVKWKTDENADSKVGYGLTTGYEIGIVSDAAAVTAHSIVLPSLAPETVYNYKITSKDQDDNSASTANLTFKTKPLPGAIKSDDFSACTLDNNVWSFINPGGDGSYSLVGSALRIDVPKDSSHDIWKDGINAPRAMQLVTNTDFTVQVKMDSAVSSRVQMQGILVQGIGDSFLRFTVQSDGTTITLSIVQGSPGDASAVFGLPLLVAPPYLRVDRLGSSWTVDYSNDGANWLPATTFNKTMTVQQVGVFAGNSGVKNQPGHVGIFDYFFNTASPIVPEDPARSLTINVAGVGNVVKDPEKPSYECNESVGLTATPANDWTFIGWSGDLSGANPTETFQITKPSVITATFENNQSYSLDVITQFVGGSNGGVITVEPDLPDYTYNDVITLTAKPEVGWGFSGWTGALTGQALTETLTIQSNSVVTGTFAKQIELLTTIVSNPAPNGTGPGGQIIKNPDKLTYDYGEQVDLVAAPDSGWTFDGWSGALSGTNLTGTLVLTESQSVTATFTQQIYDLNVTAVGNGSVTVDPDQPDYLFDDIVTLTAIPESDLYDFVGWSGDLTGTGNPAVFPIQGNTNVTATFAIDTTPIEIIEYNVVVLPGGTKAKVTWKTDVPGTSLVEYGLTPFYEIGEVGDDALVTTHSFDLTGLEPEKTYHYQLSSVDQYTNLVSTDDLTFSTRAVTGIVSDDFALCGGLDGIVWEWIDPLSDATHEVAEGELVIDVPGVTTHDVFSSGIEAPRIMQAADDKDFVIQTKFDSRLLSDGAMQGVIIEEDAENFMRFDFFKRNGQIVVYSGAFDDLTPVYSNNRIKIADVDSPLYMRITRAGDTWLHEYSFDGKSWTATSNPFTHAMHVKKVGAFGGNFKVSGNVPPHTVLLDYFFNMKSPISPEDAPYKIAIETTGQGDVTLNPDSAGYYCGQNVELQAVPASGWVFAGWNGDLSGTSPVRNITMESSLGVRAIFVEGGAGAFKAYMPMGIR